MNEKKSLKHLEWSFDIAQLLTGSFISYEGYPEKSENGRNSSPISPIFIL